MGSNLLEFERIIRDLNKTYTISNELYMVNVEGLLLQAGDSCTKGMVPRKGQPLKTSLKSIVVMAPVTAVILRENVFTQRV